MTEHPSGTHLGKWNLFTAERSGDVMTLRLNDCHSISDHDMAEITRFLAKEKPPWLLIDWAAVSYPSEVHIGLICRLRKTAKSFDGQEKHFAMRPVLCEMLKITRIEQILSRESEPSRLYQTEADALEAFAQERAAAQTEANQS